LDEQLVSSLFASPGEGGLMDLAGCGKETFALADLMTAPGRYGHPSLEAPVSAGMEIWAAGVTYESSKFARMAESSDGGDFYAKVYVAERPELFLKATPRRVVGPMAEVRIRSDAFWNVPEPELTVVAAANGRILGYTIGNDMSSRDIEGANPLYLPQAKVYRGSCAMGPMIVPAPLVSPHTLDIHLRIRRRDQTVFEGKTSTAGMRRNVEELVDWLFRENDFPGGVCLMTGTGIVPPETFTLMHGDDIEIEISGLGVLQNRVETPTAPPD
jgi:2-dehydro-3-deoxy-D-arabinonate dehydratase